VIEFLKQSVQNYVTFIFLKAIKRISATEIRVLLLINDQEKKKAGPSLTLLSPPMVRTTVLETL
jgi:hypothetical protein